jgi:GDP-4-dehydro-6-deoxy-D-mannose reductase
VRVLVTGITGFVGPWLAGALLDAGHEVHGTVRGAGPWPRLARLAPEVLHRAELDEERLGAVLRDVRPEAIVHLAGISFVPAAERDPLGAYRTNVGGLLALLAAVRAHAARARVVAVASSDVYHTGPGQDAGFVCSALARQLALIEAGRQEPVVRVGNADPVRDFSDVRDVAAGYVALIERGRTGEAYNLCSGEGVSIAEVIAILRTHARVPVRVHSDPALRRPVDVPRIVGSHARATRDTGWAPRIPLAETLGELLADWRVRVAA